MEFLLTTKKIVTIRVFNEDSLLSQITESFPGEKPDALPINLDEEEYLLLTMVQDGKIRVSSVGRELLARFDAYGFLPDSIYIERTYLEKSALTKTDEWSCFVSGLDENHIFVSRNRYDRLKKNLPKNIIPFALNSNKAGAIEYIVFCDNVVTRSRNGRVKEVLEKGCDLISHKWNILFKDLYKENSPPYVFSDFETYGPTYGTVRAHTLSLEEYLDILNGDVHQLLTSLEAYFNVDANYNSTITEEYFKKDASRPQVLDRNLNLKSLSALIDNLDFTSEIERILKKIQITYTNIFSTDKDSNSYITIAIYGFIRT